MALLSKKYDVIISTLKMTAVISSEASVPILTIMSYIAEDGKFHNYRRDNLKSYTYIQDYPQPLPMGGTFSCHTHTKPLDKDCEV
jgi:hypothetical protein